jgi:AcrR family transcriptional regulator
MRQPGRPVAGLRERKKARTRAAIRRHALRLFREQGYAATTVEQIAEAAEVSPSTFFRYFPTKEDVVLQDELDARTLESFEAQPPELSTIAAFRAAWADTFSAMGPEDLDRLRETAVLTLSAPELRARTLDELTRTLDVIAEATAKRTGRKPDDLAVRNTAGAIIGVIIAVSLPLRADDLDEDWFPRIDAALAHLEAGLPL